MATSPPMPRCCWPGRRVEPARGPGAGRRAAAGRRHRRGGDRRPASELPPRRRMGPATGSTPRAPTAATTAAAAHRGRRCVSANPGPLHVGHGRAGAIGDCIAACRANGWDAARVLLQRRRRADQQPGMHRPAPGSKPGDAQCPADAYNGDYIADVAAAYLRGERGGRRPGGHGRLIRRPGGDPPVRRGLAAPRAERRPGRVRRDLTLLPRVIAVYRRQGRGNGQPWSPTATPTGRRRAVAAHHRVR